MGIKGKRGGKQPGAGRPKGSVAPSTLKARHQREYLVEQFELHLLPIVTVAIDQALAGDKAARDWLTEHAWGKALSRNEITGKDGKDINEPSEAVKKLAEFIRVHSQRD